MSGTEVGIAGIILFFVLVFLNLPIGIAMALIGVAGVGVLLGVEKGLTVLGLELFRVSSTYVFGVVPLFVGMGFLASVSGLSADAFYSINKWIGNVRGGLAMAATAACALFAAICGCAVATAGTVAAVSLPEMRKHKYSDTLSLGVLAAGGNLGFLIPPSLGFILYAILTEQSIGVLFISGILPGLLLTVLFMFTIWLMVRINPRLAPTTPSASWMERLVSLRYLTGAVAVIVLVLGGIYAGIFTPTEAGGIGVLGVLIVGLINRKLKWQGLISALYETIRMTGLMFLLVGGAMVFSRFIALTQLPMVLAGTIGALAISPYAVLAIVLIFYILVGFIMDIMAMILLLAPIFHPVLVALGFDPVWLACITIVTVLMGHISPPVGIVVYALSGMVKDAPVFTIFRGALPFLGAMLVCLIILIVFPEIVLVLPNLMRPG